METSEFREKIEGVARALGMEADFSRTTDYHYNACDLKYHGTALAWVTNGGGYCKPGEGRICFSSIFPNDMKGQTQARPEDRIEITVAATKDADKIAKDLKARFFPKYHESLERVQKRVKASNDYIEGRRSSIKRLADYFGEPFADDFNRRGEEAVYPSHHNDVPGLGSMIRMYGGGEIQFELRLPVEKAIEVFETLKALKPKCRHTSFEIHENRGAGATDLLRAAEEMIEWGAQMGGWEGPAWANLRSAIHKAKGGETSGSSRQG